MYSYWENKYWFEIYDYIIVGAGIVGLTSALMLKRRLPDSNILFLERNAIPQGASTKNAGFSCFGTVGEIVDDLKSMSESEVIKTIKLRYEGLQLLKELHTPNSIDYTSNGGYEMFDSEENFGALNSEVAKVNELVEAAIGIKKVFQVIKSPKHFNFYTSCIYNAYEAQLNPVLMVKSLISMARDLGIQLGFGFDVDSYTVEGDNYLLRINNELLVRGKNLLLTTNAFVKNLLADLDVVPARNQVLVSEPIPDLKVKGTYHFDKGYVYFRDIDNRLLIGGARNIAPESEMTADFGPNASIEKHLVEFAERHILDQKLKIAYKWSGIIATGSTKNPIVRKINSGLYTAVRLGGMGVAIGSKTASQLVDLVTEG